MGQPRQIEESKKIYKGVGTYIAIIIMGVSLIFAAIALSLPYYKSDK
jgi:hypothetical protein